MGRRFWILWSAEAGSMMGDQIAFLVLPLYVTTMTSSSTAVTWLYTAENIPIVVIGLIGGVWIDRLRSRPLMLATDLFRAGVWILLAVLAAAGLSAPWVLWLASFCVGLATAAFSAALWTLIPSLVSEKNLDRANARTDLAQRASLMVGPLLGGFIVATHSYTLAFVINAVTFLLSAVGVWFAGPGTKAAPRTETSVLESALAGLRVIWSEPVIRGTTIVAAMASVIVGVSESAFVLIGLNLFHTSDPAQLGGLLVAVGAAGVVGALAASRLVPRLGEVVSVCGGSLVFAAGVFGVALFSNPWVAGACYLAGMFCIPTISVAVVGLRQRRAPEGTLGRVNAASRAVIWSTLPISAFFAGVVIDATSEAFLLQAVSVAAALTAVVTWWWVRRATFSPPSSSLG